MLGNGLLKLAVRAQVNSSAATSTTSNSFGLAVTYLYLPTMLSGLLASKIPRVLPAGRHALAYSSRTITTGPLKLKDAKYTAVGVATGQGRNGQTECNGLKLQLATPKELGGTGQGENPEQLFAMGYSACFLGALQAVAGRAGQKDKIANAVVNAKVTLGEPEGLGGFGIGVELEVSGAPQDLVEAAHEFCPYSRALKYGVEVTAKAV